MPEVLIWTVVALIAALLVIALRRAYLLDRRVKMLGQMDQAIENVSKLPPIPIDPDNPPRTMYYRPKGPAAEARCSCHNRLLVFNEEVLFWPQPDGAVLLFCHAFDPEKYTG